MRFTEGLLVLFDSFYRLSIETAVPKYVSLEFTKRAEKAHFVSFAPDSHVSASSAILVHPVSRYQSPPRRQ